MGLNNTKDRYTSIKFGMKKPCLKLSESYFALFIFYFDYT